MVLLFLLQWWFLALGVFASYMNEREAVWPCIIMSSIMLAARLVIRELKDRPND